MLLPDDEQSEAVPLCVSPVNFNFKGKSGFVFFNVLSMII